MAKWDLSKLPEGRKPLPDEWFAERAQMQDRINGLEERLKAAQDDANEAEAYAGELEAKLAKALDFIQDLTGCEWPYDEDAKRILAELTSSEVKGGKDE